MKNHVLFLAATFAAASVLTAQDDKKQPADAAQQKPADPKTKQHDALKALTGDWDCVMKTSAVPGVPGMEKASESKGSEHAELICNGLWLKSTVNGIYQGAPMEGVWIAGYDPHKKVYTSVWVSSCEQDTGACTLTGRYDERAKSWEWNGTTPHGAMRSTLAFKDQDTTVETCYMVGLDRKETQCMEITRKRSKTAGAKEAAAKAPKLSAQQEAMLKEVGVWDATVKAMPPGQPTTEEKATEKITAVCDGHWLWSDFNGQFMGMPFEGHALYGYDAAQGKCVSWWIDTMSPVAAQTSGAFDPAKETCTLEGSSVDENGKPIAIKEVITWKDDNTRHLQMEFKGADGTSKLEITYKRKTQD